VSDAAARPARVRARPAAVLLDRDGTLCVDVPYNGDPDSVILMPGAAEALERLHSEGIVTALISNQSGVARGLISIAQVDAVNARLSELVGGVGPMLVCPHGPEENCSCRKPAPGLVLAAAEAVGVDPVDCVVIGDIGADQLAARAAGARAVLVPTEATLEAEVVAARSERALAPDLRTAVALVLDGEPAPWSVG